MMYTVTWLPSAEQELANLWNNAADRSQLAAAANAIDDALAANPLDAGESRGGITRIVFERPLAVLFDVDRSDRTAKVWDVWRYPE
jgi:plasmid stabilization system protein ParE